MAILWRAALGQHAAMPLDGWNDTNTSHRPVFWITPGSGRRVGCIHAPSNGGDMPYINGAIAAIANGATAGWILAGDFNIAPGKLSGMPTGVTAIDTKGQTQTGGGNLDYLLHDGVAPFTNCHSANAYVGSSDHLQVRFS
jgi:hypothetical protein